MIQELTAEQFQNEVLASEIPVLVDFWSPECRPCKLLNPVLSELAAEGMGRFQVKKIDIWSEPELAARFRISDVGQAVPAGVQRLTETAGHSANASGSPRHYGAFCSSRNCWPAARRDMESRFPAGTA